MTEERSVDTDRQADQAWILGVQRKLYQWSKVNPDDSWRDMWGWLTDHASSQLATRGLEPRPPIRWGRRDDRGAHPRQDRGTAVPRRASSRIALQRISTEPVAAQAHPQSG